jgi:hypothetical protein
VATNSSFRCAVSASSIQFTCFITHFWNLFINMVILRFPSGYFLSNYLSKNEECIYCKRWGFHGDYINDLPDWRAVVFWPCVNVSEKHTGSIIRAEVLKFLWNAGKQPKYYTTQQSGRSSIFFRYTVSHKDRNTQS